MKEESEERKENGRKSLQDEEKRKSVKEKREKNVVK